MVGLSNLLVSLSLFLLQIQRTPADDLRDTSPCSHRIIDYVNGTHKEEYRVGVLAIRGSDAAFSEFNATFSDYLTATAGQRFSRPIKFTMVSLNFIQLFSDVELSINTNGAEGVDFIYVNPSAFSCIESEYGSNTLVSQISRRVVGGEVYHLTKFGGVIFTRSDNDEINSVEDIRDKSVACASISGLGSGQMQFRLLQQRGLSYIQDPKQLVFTSDQGPVVNGVLQGKFDVGFVRTDQIESTIDDRTGELVNTSEVKIINPQIQTLDGEPFPFVSSTILYPEWNLASLDHVSNDLAIEVQAAMLAIGDHAAVGKAISNCLGETNCTDPLGSVCYTACVAQVDPSLAARCDSSPDIAALAFTAQTNGKYAGWRSTLSYMELRDMQEETNFIRKDDDLINRCIRSANITKAVICPPGHFKKSDEEILSGCTDAGLDCGEFQCLCKPCVKAYDVDVFPIDDINHVEDGACQKFAICGTVQQSYTLNFRAIDNKQREDADLRVRILEGELERDIPSRKTKNFTYEFSFDATESETGVVIFQVYVGDEQIPESPFRLYVAERDCAEENNDPLQIADSIGNCVCSRGSTRIGMKCVANAVLIPSILLPLLCLLALSVYFYVERKKAQANSLWAVKPEELTFDDPPAILGRGTFGLVLLAEYRGTQVAVKRVIPPKTKRLKGGSASTTWRNVLLGDGDAEELEEIPCFLPQGVDVFVDSSAANSNVEQNADFDATESGAMDHAAMSHRKSNESNTEQSSTSQSGQIRRRASLAANDKSVSNLFDFENMQDNLRGQSKSYGMESGGIDRVIQDLHTETIAFPVKRRRHSFGSLVMEKGSGESSSILAAVALAAATYGESDEDDDIVGATNPASQSVCARRVSGGSGNSASQTFGASQTSFCGSIPRRHSLGGVTTLLPHSLDATPSFKQKKKPDQRPALQQSSNRSMSGSWSNRISRVGRRGSDNSCGSLKGKEFNEMLQNEEELELESALKSDVGTKSGSHGLRSGRSSSSYPLSGHIHSNNNKGGLKKVTNIMFGSRDEYARLRSDFIDEMQQLSKLRHPCITTVMGAVIEKRSEPMLVMEYMDHGSLYDILHNESMIVDGELVLPILRDIAQGVRFLHAATPRVIHGDLKAQNVLVDSKFRAKVADFGLSQKKKIGATGTPLWMAPELLRGESENNAMSDVYSFGIILYEVYSRKDPYEGENHLEILRQVCDPAINLRPPVPKICPPKVAGIMIDCLVADPENRPTFEELDLRLKRLDVENVEPGQTIFSMQKKKEQRALRNEELLFDVFPRHVAEALRDGRKLEAEAFECVTIFFSDIVGYTTICSKMHPKKVSDMLDRLYLKFDMLSDKHDIFKIETIGDAYMAVTGLHKQQEDHAARVARFSIDAITAANETLIDADDPAKGFVQIRVGFHSGSIVANVVGSRCPKYTLFGDVVNTASRMESNSLPGRIQCSERSAQLVKEQDPTIPVIDRGKIHVKGKGEMRTSWIGELCASDIDKAKIRTSSSKGDPESLDAILEGSAKV